VANVDATVSKQQLNPLDPAQVYENNAGVIYSIIRYFLPEPQAIEAVETIAHDLFSLVPKSGYARYAKLLCLKTVYVYLTNDPRVKISRGDRSFKQF